MTPFTKMEMWILSAIIPLLLASSPVSVNPPNPVTTVGSERYVFRCVLVTTWTGRLLSATWLLNGTALESLGLDGVTADFSTIGSGIGRLTFTSLSLEYNYTVIQCHGHLDTAENFTSEGVILLLQGTLAAVGELNIRSLNSTATLTWTAPFSLIPVGITYTVGVVSPAFSSTLLMEDGVAITEFAYPLPPRSDCDNLMFTVTPKNGAGDGMPNSITLSQAIEPPHLVELHSPTLAPRNGTGGVMDLLTYHISMSSLVCSAEITLTDKNTGEVITLRDADLNIATLGGITFTNERLQALDRRFVFTVNASNINGSVTFSGDISTYDVVNSAIHTNPLRVHTEYLPNSDAAGVLYGFFYIGENGIDFSRSAYFALSRNDSLSYELPFPLPSGVYYVHTYIIREDGLLSSGEIVPVTTEVFSGSGGTEVPINNPPSSSEIDDCDMSSSGLTISVLCSFPPTSSSTGFLLVVQEMSANGARRLLVNTTELGEPQGPVTVQVEVGGAYQVTVFPIREGMGILESNVAYTVMIAVNVANNPMPGVADITTQRVSTTSPTVTLVADILPIIIGVGGGLGVLALLAVILMGVIILVVVCHRPKGSNMQQDVKSMEKTIPGDKEEGIGLTVRNSLIYEEIGDAKSSFAYTKNGQSMATASRSHKQTSNPTPDVATGVSVDVIDKVKSSFSYTKNAVYGLTTTGVTSDPIPEMCTGVVPPNRKVNTDEYVLMQAAVFSEKADDPDQEDSKALVKSCDSNNPGTEAATSSVKSCDLKISDQEDTEANTPSVKSCDPKFPGQAYFSGLLSETSCDPNDPDQAGNGGASCDPKECSAYI